MLTIDIWGILWEECQTLAELYFTKVMSEAWSEQMAGWQGKAAGMFLEHSMTFVHGCQVTNKARLTNDLNSLNKDDIRISKDTRHK